MKRRNQKSKSTPVVVPVGPAQVPCTKVAELAIDLWKIGARAQSEGASERVRAACDRAGDRLRSLGFEIDTMTDRPYDENLKVRVVDHEEADEPRHICECLTPAVYFDGKLIREAEVVTRGK